MDERQFMEDVWDILLQNTNFITLSVFAEKYRELFTEINCTTGVITLRDEHNEYELSIRKVYTNQPNK